MNFVGGLNGKMFYNPVDFLLEALNPDGEIVPEEAVEIVWSEMTDSQRKDLALKNHKYWMKYLGLKVGDKFNAYYGDSSSIFNPMEVVENGIILKDDVYPDHWYRALIIQSGNESVEIIPDQKLVLMDKLVELLAQADELRKEIERL